MRASKITLFALIIFSQINILSQTVPVTFHFKPEYTDFQVLRIVGTFNGWNNADANMVMTDPDGDGEYEITLQLAAGADHNYKFVMDADWGLAWTDPDNPRINVSDNNNSLITVKDPMITYLLPRGVNSKGEKFIDNTEEGLPIRAIIAFSDANPIDINSLVVTIDDVPLANPQQYYDESKKEFIYHPDPSLSVGNHSVVVSISSNAGSDSRSAVFERDDSYIIYQVPVDFYYDANNSRVLFTQDLTEVSAVGEFNNWNDAFDPMNDDDGDGLWETTVMMTEGSFEYKFKLNKFFWTSDPDEPKFGATADLNSLVIADADSIPRIKLIEPVETTVYTQELVNSTFSAILRPGVKSGGIDESTIKVIADGATVAHSFDTSTAIVSADVTFTGEGLHTITTTYKNLAGRTATKTFAYGIYLGETGKYFVDAVNDEVYTYPSGAANSCDIRTILIDETPGHDSLKFKILMKDVTDRTRVGFIITNPSNNLVPDPLDLEIQTYEWDGEGVFVSIGAPGNSYENTDVENRFALQRSPLTFSDKILDVNTDAKSKNYFEFKISLQYLDSIMTGWIGERYFYIFSFLAADDKSGKGFEVGYLQGGSYLNEDPDIYDAAFMRGSLWQQRMLSNYILQGENQGPRYVSLDGSGRGLVSLKAEDISDSLASFGPVITWLTPGVTYWYSDVTVYGQLSDSLITTITVSRDGVESDYPVTNGQFSILVTLNMGENSFTASALNDEGFIGISRELVITYDPDINPFAAIDAVVNGRDVTLTVNASSPINSPLTFYWYDDINNPADINLTSTDGSVVVTIPEVDGEYYFNVRVRDADFREFTAREMVFASNESVTIPDINQHSSWIDKAIVYEIYPRSFSDQGGFPGVIDKIPHMTSLGINTVWFMPIYDGPTAHGYEITDYYGFESDYGTEEEFIQMVDALKQAGIRVVLDYVVNHTSVQHPFMQNAFEYREYSPWSDFYIWEGEPGNSTYQFYFDWASLPNLNHNNPDVRKYFIDAAMHWVSTYGIDGYRCDVAWGVEERNTQFWQEWREALKNIKPEVLLEAEASSSETEFYDKRFDSANDWDLRNKLLDAINGTTTLTTLHNEITRNYVSHARPFRFVENHDEVRVAAMFDYKRSVLAHAILFTVNGIPLIYSGGEVGEITRRDLIDWSDPENIFPIFQRLTRIRRDYLVNPQVTRLPNSDADNVYTYNSTSGENNIVVAANFRNADKNITIDLSSLSWDGTSAYYLTDLVDGTVYEIQPAQHNSFPLSLTEFDVKIFYYGAESVVVDVDENTDAQIPAEFSLSQNYPNPFNPTTKIKFSLSPTLSQWERVSEGRVRVTLKVFDILGREVQTLVNETKEPGAYEVEFNASNLSSGVYFYQLSVGSFGQTGTFVATKKLMLIK